MLVNDFIDNQIGSLPEGLYESLPRVCPDCGFPMEMSEALTQLHCSNNRCPSKIAQRLVALATMLGVKDMGASRAEKFVKTHNVTNPLYIFKYNPDTDGAMADSISLDDLSIIYRKMNNDKKEGKEYPNDLILKCIYSSYEFLIDIDIDDFRKNQYIERLKKIGDDYIHELINLNDKDYESNANISEVDLRVKYLKRIIKLEDEINHLARVNADDLLVDLYSMKKRMTL